MDAAEDRRRGREKRMGEGWVVWVAVERRDWVSLSSLHLYARVSASQHARATFSQLTSSVAPRAFGRSPELGTQTVTKKTSS